MRRAHVAALAESGSGSRVHAGAEGIYKVKSVALEGTDILAEQGENQRFLRLQNMKAGEREPADDRNDDTDGKGDSAGILTLHIPHKERNYQQIEQKSGKENQHAVFFLG